MLGLFKKKTEEPAVEEEKEEDTESSEEEKKKTEPTSAEGNTSLITLSTEVDRIKASVESFSEVRKSLTERLTGLNEQIGELRAMIMDRDRTIQEVELKAIKASDLVETVQPEKLMLEIQREDVKFEALRANVEGNEAIMDRIMEELRELRRKMDFFKGIEEVVKLSEEVKKELIQIKKVEATIQINTDKMETIYAEMRKRYQEINVMTEDFKEVKIKTDQQGKDIENIKLKMSELARKEDVEKVSEQVQKYLSSLKEVSGSSSLSNDLKQLKSLLDNFK